MRIFLATRGVAIAALLGTSISFAQATSASASPSGPVVVKGASASAPVAPDVFDGDLRDLPQAETWKQGDVELEKSIAIYERGAELKKHCESRLKAAELKVEQIVQGSDGAPKTEPASFD